MIKTIIIILLLTTMTMATARDYVLKTKRLSDYSVGLICSNGSDPTGTKVGDMVIISCGK